jgi:hypothetical protein
MQTHQPELVAAGVAAGAIPASEVPMIRYKVAPGGVAKQDKPLAQTGKVTSMAGLATAFGASKQQQQQQQSANMLLPDKDGAAYWEKTHSLRTTAIALDDILRVRAARRCLEQSCLQSSAEQRIMLVKHLGKH